MQQQQKSKRVKKNAKQFARNRVLQRIEDGTWVNAAGKAGHSNKDALHDGRDSRGTKKHPNRSSS